MSGRIVTVEVNQQQAELIDRLVAEGLGASRAEVIRNGFLGFCDEHAAEVGPLDGAE
jgi:Arc/MetJ-type ribon-helix-helix transcriptional regulator